MESILRLFPDIKQYRLSYRLLMYVVLCSSLFALLATATQLYLDYRRDVSALYKSFSFIEKSYLPAIAASTFKIDTDHLPLELEGALKLPDIIYLEVNELICHDFSILFNSKENNPSGKKLEFPLFYQFASSRLQHDGFGAVNLFGQQISQENRAKGLVK